MIPNLKLTTREKLEAAILDIDRINLFINGYDDDLITLELLIHHYGIETTTNDLRSSLAILKDFVDDLRELIIKIQNDEDVE
jgi:hypothetical protein